MKKTISVLSTQRISWNFCDHNFYFALCFQFLKAGMLIVTDGQMYIMLNNHIFRHVSMSNTLIHDIVRFKTLLHDNQTFVIHENVFSINHDSAIVQYVNTIKNYKTFPITTEHIFYYEKNIIALQENILYHIFNSEWTEWKACTPLSRFKLENYISTQWEHYILFFAKHTRHGEKFTKYCPKNIFYTKIICYDIRKNTVSYVYPTSKKEHFFQSDCMRLYDFSGLSGVLKMSCNQFLVIPQNRSISMYFIFLTLTEVHGVVHGVWTKYPYNVNILSSLHHEMLPWYFLKRKNGVLSLYVLDKGVWHFYTNDKQPLQNCNGQ
jgi:hypothetical protein